MKTKKHQWGKAQNLKWEKNKIKYGSIGFGGCFQVTDITDLLLRAMETDSSPGS